MNTCSFGNSYSFRFAPGMCHAVCGTGLPEPQEQCPFCRISRERAASQGRLHLAMKTRPGDKRATDRRNAHPREARPPTPPTGTAVAAFFYDVSVTLKFTAGSGGFGPREMYTDGH